MRDEDAGVAGRVGVDTDDRLLAQVFGDVGYQPVLADDDDESSGRNAPGR
jgi:hypothetical protein